MNTVTMDGRSSRWDGHRRDRHEEMCRIVRRAVHAQGADLSMDAMAAALGTSKSIIYRYFGDKAGLQDAVGAQILRDFATSLQQAAAQGVAGRDQIAQMVRLYLVMLAKSPNVYYFITTGETKPSALPGFISQITELVATTIAPHEDEVMARIWAAGAVGMVQGAGEEWLSGGRIYPVDVVAKALTNWIWAKYCIEEDAQEES